jgi:hypothetical protein
MSQWTARPEPSLDRYAVEWADGDGLILSRRNRLFHRAPGRAPRPAAQIPAPAWKAAASRLRLVQRLLRFTTQNVLRLPDGSWFVTFDRRIGVVRDGRYRQLEGMRRPFRVLRSACALAADGNVYLGEYYRNPERDDVCVYRYTPGTSRLEEVHRFPAGEVRHIHGIYRDPFTDKLWCLTGDRDDECRFMTTDDGFGHLELVGAGDESWRCVSVQFTERHVYYGTDAEFRPNHLYRLDRATGEREQLGQIDGPVFYSRALGGELFFAVTAELCPSQKGRAATLWHVSDTAGPSKVVAFEKDAWSRRWFGFGFLYLSRGPGDGRGLYLHGVGLTGADNRTYRIAPQAGS